MWVPLRPLRKLGVAVIALLVTQIGVMLFGIGAHLSRIHIVDQLLAGGLADEADFTSADAIAGASEILAGIGLLTCAVVWLIWQHRGQSNARAFTEGKTKFSPGWAVGWWFIPIANLFLPFLAMRELWRASFGRTAWRNRTPSPVIGLWWVALLGYGFTGFGGSSRRESYAAIRNADRVSLASLAFGVVAAVLAIWIVWSITRRQDEAAMEPPVAPSLTSIPPPPPPSA